MRTYVRKQQQAKRKALNQTTRQLQPEQILGELLPSMRQDIESFAAELGLVVMERMIEEEIRQKLGAWGQQPAHRHGSQPGYVCFGGRKVPFQRPRVRNLQKEEVSLSSYRAFQTQGKLQEAVARKMMRQCSTRDYQGAIEGCLKGYGISRSSVSRHWKAATARELKALMERPVPPEVLVLMIDSKFFAGDCLAVALGIDSQGKKHVLGLWHGATENSTVVSGLLQDLVSRGLDDQQKMLIVIDGAKALRKAVRMVLGDRAVVQRCRIHKLRNVLDYLPREKQAQARRRLTMAWGQKDPDSAEKQLRSAARWLQKCWPMAANSLLEGLEETLTVQRLDLPAKLSRALSNTNIIENCFSGVAYRTHRVKNWQDPQMVMRWAANCLLWAEQRFRRFNGCEQLRLLEKSLRQN